MSTTTTKPHTNGPEPLPHAFCPPAPSGVFGLRVRVAVTVTQRCLFGQDGPSLPTRLAEELCTLIARAVFSDFRIHSQLERSVPAVLRNVRLGFWSCARRAALDTASALASAAKRRICQFELAVQATNLAIRIAEICESCERKIRAEKLGVENRERDMRAEAAALYREQREDRAARIAEGR